MKHPIHLIRPVNLALIALTMGVVLIKYHNEQVEWYWMKALLLIIPAILTAASGYVVNDIKDIETDQINRPDQRIVGLSISVRKAWVIYSILCMLSLIVSYLFSKQYTVVNLCILTMLYLYAVALKGLPLIGNLLVALCSALVIAICILLIAFKTEAARMNFTGYVIFAFIISLIRELVKDIQDVKGDAVAGLKTYPIVFGTKGAKVLIYAFTGIEILFCGIYSFLSWGVDMYASSIIMGLITFSMFYFINHVSKAKSEDDFGNASRFIKYVMFAGVLNLIFA